MIQIDSSSNTLPVIVAVTGDTTQKYQNLAKECGMQVLMSKPLNSNDLKRLLIDNGIFWNNF